MYMSVYQIAQEYQLLAQQLADLESDEPTMTDRLEAMSGELTQHIIELTKVYRNLESFAEAIHEAEKSMAQRRYHYEARAQRIKEYVFQTLLNTGLKKVECPEFGISLRNNPPTVMIDPLTKLPDEYLRMPLPPTPLPDKVRIKAALQAGESIPGCRLEQQKRLVIE